MPDCSAVRALILSLVAVLAAGAFNPAVAEDRPSVLFVGSSKGNAPRDIREWDQWLDTGFEIDARDIGAIKSVADLEPFNVVIVTRVPQFSADGEPRPELETFWDILDEYMRAGGGVFTMWGGSRWEQQSRPLKHWLERYGASIPLPEEQVTDPEHVFGNVGRAGIGCYTTRVIEAPMTEGIEVIGYLGDLNGHERMTMPLVIEDESAWRVAVRGEQSAYSALPKMSRGKPQGVGDEPAAYDSAPPLAAYRSVGEGRFFAFPQNIAPTITSPAVFNGALWDKPGTTPAGPVQNREFIHQTLRWLAEPTLGDAGRFGGYETPRDFNPTQSAILDADVQAIDWSSAPPVSEMDRYRMQGHQRGLIGAQSTFSGGEHTVAKLCAAAREAGLQFLGFTERMSVLDAESWRKLKEACQRESSESFTALPGMIGQDRVGNTWFALGYADYPQPPGVTPQGDRVDSTLHFWAQSFGKRFVGFADVASNPNPWYEMKHSSAFAVYTMRGSAQHNDTAEHEYLRASYNQDIYVPTRITIIDSLEDVRERADGMVNVFGAEQPSDLTVYARGDAPYDRQPNKTYNKRWYLTAGPQLAYHGGRNLGNLATDPAKQNRYRYGFKLTNLQSGDRILLMDGPEVFREWRADSDTFATQHTWPHDQSRSFVLRVKRGGETVMLSAPVTVHYGRRFQMVGDRQNTLPYNYQPDAEGDFYVTGGPLGPRYKGWAPNTLIYGNFKQWLSGAVGVEHTPRMYAGFQTAPRIRFDHPKADQGDGRDMASHQIHRLSCPGVVVVDEVAHRHYPGSSKHPGGAPPLRTKPLELYQFDQRRYGIYGMLDQRNAQYIESEILALRDVSLRGSNVRVSAYTRSIEPESSMYVETRAGGAVKRYPFNEPPEDQTYPLAPGEYTGYYPYGLMEGGAHYAVEGDFSTRLRATGENGTMVSTIELKTPMQWQRGETFSYSLLFSSGASKPYQDRSDFQAITRFLGLGDTSFPAITGIKNGELLDEPVLATIEAQRSRTLRLTTRANEDDPIGLTVRVRGLQPNWQVVYTLNDADVWRFCGELEGDLYFNLYTNQEAYAVALGHPVTADNEDVRIRLDDSDGGRSTFEIYNPTARAVDVTLETNPDFLPAQEQRIAIEPHDSQRVTFQSEQ